MNQHMFDDMELQKLIKHQFDIQLDIAEVITRAVPVGAAAQATVFKTGNGHVFIYIMSQSSLLLDDMRKIARAMQCEVAVTYPPHGDVDYFDRIAREKFKTLFPGKHITGEDDLRYYKNVAQYNPALFRLARIAGEIRGLEPHTKTWRKVRDYSYSVIKPS